MCSVLRQITRYYFIFNESAIMLRMLTEQQASFSLELKLMTLIHSKKVSIRHRRKQNEIK